MDPITKDVVARQPEWQQLADQDIDRAIRALSFAVDFAGHGNEKPVVLHSVRVALLLRQLGYSRDIQVAGALHDIIQNTSYPLHDIALDFGDGVADIVAANTLDTSIEEWAERYQEGLGRCIEAGSAAAIVKAVDLFDEAPLQDEAWLDAPRFFLRSSYHMIGREAVWQLLAERVQALEQEYAENAQAAGEQD
jgi:guanosine-3',5'-bis(diphosphate) 3'-pyrophosphohydrolase